MGWREHLGGVAVDLGTSSIRVAGSLTRQIREVPARSGGRNALARGVVADVDCAAALLRPLLRQAGPGFLRPRVVASAPTDAGPDGRERLIAAIRAAGARGVVVFPEPLSAAVGAGLDVGSPYAQMIVDIGHGVTDALVVRGGAVVRSLAERVGTGDLEDTVRGHVERAAGARMVAGSELQLLRELRFDRAPAGAGTTRVESAGDLVAVDLAALAAAVQPVAERILDVALRLLRDVDDEVGAELVESGFWVTGGGALLPGMVAALAARTRLDVRQVAEPLGAVVEGNRSLLDTVAVVGGWEE